MFSSSTALTHFSKKKKTKYTTKHQNISYKRSIAPCEGNPMDPVVVKYKNGKTVNSIVLVGFSLRMKLGLRGGETGKVITFGG